MLARYQFTVTDDAGNVLPGASVTVRREITGAPLASLFSDREGVTPTGNPLTADADGFVAFHVVGGAYRITATLGGFSRTWRYVGIGLASESDGLTLGAPFLFSTSTADTDHGDGYLALNNASPASATKMFISELNSLGLDVGAWLGSFDDGGSAGNRGTLTIASVDGSAIVVATVTGTVADDGDYRDISFTVLTAAGSFTQDQAVYIQFSQRATDGINGTRAGYLFNFDSSTSMADPGAGDFRLNDATLSSVTAAAFDDTSAESGNPDVSAAVLSWDDSTNTIRGYLLIKDAAAPQNFVVYSITGASTDNAGWTQLALTYVTHAGSLTNGNPCTVEFSRAGDVGSSGTVVGKQSIWIPAGAMTPRVTSGAATGSIDSGSNDNTIQCLDFDQTSAEHAQFTIGMPKSWNESTVTFTPYWTAAGGSAAQTMIFSLSGAAISNDDVLNTAQGTPQTSSDALIATGDLHIGPESAAITIGGTPSEGDLVVFNVARDISDTLAADARLIGIMLHITLNANTDA